MLQVTRLLTPLAALSAVAAGPLPQDPYISAALGTARWINATCLRGDGGSCSWAMNSTDDAPRNYPYLASSLYYGPPGVACGAWIDDAVAVQLSTCPCQWVPEAFGLTSTCERIVGAVTVDGNALL